MARPTTYGDKFTCVECSRSEPEVKHSSHGLCRGCSRKKQYKEKKPRQKWARDYDKCIRCKRTTVDHQAHGLCVSCYNTKHRDDNKNYYLEVEQKRREQPEAKEKQRKRYGSWYQRNREEHIRKTTEYRRQHPEIYNESSKKYRELNPDKIKRFWSSYYQKNKEFLLQQKREYRQKNKDKVKEINKKWRDKNPNKVKGYDHKRKMLKLGIEGSHTHDEFIEKLKEFYHLCAYCGIDLEKIKSKDITEDHIVPITKGGTDYIENIVPACRSCNSEKKQMTGEKYLKYREKKYGSDDENIIDIFETINSMLNIKSVLKYKIDNVMFDIYIPSKSIAIDYRSLYEHGEDMAADRYENYRKYQLCQRNNIRYVCVFEDEWKQNTDRTIDYFKAILGCNDNKIKLRPQKLTIEYTNYRSKEIKQFLDNYHYLGGNTSLKHIWVAIYENQIIGILGIGCPTRQKIKELLELKRVCMHPQYKCYGLWGYLIKRYVAPELGNTTLTSFSDNRKDTGALYKKVNFEQVYVLRPDYYWCKDGQRFHKSRFKKTEEEKQLNKTEAELRKEQGYFRIYDCGKTKWNLDLSSIS